MNILRLDHVALLVSDVEQSCRFYSEALGMEATTGLGTTWMKKDNVEIHLLQEPDERKVLPIRHHPEELTRGHITHYALEVESMEEAQRHLKAKHVEIVCGPRPRGNDGEQLYVCDPDGYVIELFTRRTKN